MIAIDTNIVIRLLTGDDPEQYEKAQRLVKRNVVFVPETVLLECHWVLSCTYQFSRQQVFDGLKRFLGLEHVTVSRSEAIFNALIWFRDGMDFSDALHLAACTHCDRLATFDRAFIKSAKSRSSCKVVSP